MSARLGKMDRETFQKLFNDALASAATSAGLGPPSNGDFEVQLHLHGRHDGLTPAETLERLYLGPDKFFKVIDVVVLGVRADKVQAFVRVSGHEPGTFAETWSPQGTGPFKILTPIGASETPAP
jgi:hypothetical protein